MVVVGRCVSQFTRVQIDREDGSGFVDPALGLKSGGESGAWTNDIGFQARRERRIKKKAKGPSPARRYLAPTPDEIGKGTKYSISVSPDQSHRRAVRQDQFPVIAFSTSMVFSTTSHLLAL